MTSKEREVELLDKIFIKDELIKELQEKLQMEEMVKKSEIYLNQDLNERIEKLKLHNDTLIKINENYSNIISKLRLQLKNILFKI
jgi:hypothetical protein